MCVCMLMAVVVTNFNGMYGRGVSRSCKSASEAWGDQYFPNFVSSPFSEIRKAVTVCETLMNEKDSPVLGLHVEGPYLNPEKSR